MNIYELDEAGLRFAENARQLARDVAAPAAADVDERGRFPEEAVSRAGADGLCGLCLPAAVGGAGQPPRVFAAVVEELAQACPSTAMIYVMHVTAAQAIAAASGMEEVLGEITAGRHLTTLAFSERGSRSHFWAPVSQLEKNGSGYVTSANKSWVTSANRADSYVSSAQAPEAQSPLESVLYLVRRNSEHVRVDGEFRGLGLRGNDSAPVVFDGLRVASDDLLTAPGDGAQAMLETVLPWFVVGTAAMAHGLCLAALTATTGHLSSTGFEHTGEKLRDLPNLRARLAEMSVRTAQSQSLLARCVAAMEQPDEQTPLLVLQSRLAALEAAHAVTDLAMKTCGGAAFSRHLAVERMFRDARAGWVMAPTVDHLHEFIGKALTGLPLF